MGLFDKIAKARDVSMSSNLGAYGSHGHMGDMFVIPGAVQELPKPKPMNEIGVTGLLRTRGVGYVYEEWLNQLSTYRQKMVFREMRDNDAVIGSLFFALEMILRKAEWRVEPAAGPKGDKYAEFIDSCMKDMSHTWEDFVAEIVSMFAFGYHLCETVYKRRMGPDGRSASQFDDGLIGWRKMAPRAQESILYWIWDDEGGLQGAVQLAAPDYHTVPIPIEKMLLFRTTSLKNNPEGRSILRNCFRSWFFKRRIEEVEGIGIERDLCGLPVLYADAETINAMGGLSQAQKLVSNIRVDDQMGVVLPMAFDDKGNKLVELALLKSAGPKQTDASATITRYNQDILNTVLAGFVQFGQTPTGSRALHMSATQIFTLAIGAFMDNVAAVINRIAIPRLMTLNKMDLKSRPKLVPGDIGVRDLDELGTFLQQCSQAGLTFFDPPTQDYIRKVARLPEAPKDDNDNIMPSGGPDGGQTLAPGQQTDEEGNPLPSGYSGTGNPGEPGQAPGQLDPSKIGSTIQGWLAQGIDPKDLESFIDQLQQQQAEQDQQSQNGKQNGKPAQKKPAAKKPQQKPQPA